MKSNSYASVALSRDGVLGRTIWSVVERTNVALYLLAVLIVFAILQPGAFTAGSAATVIQLSVPMLVVATGMMFCLLCGEVDLSVAGIAGLASTVVALKMDQGMSCPYAIALALLIGIGVGMVNGVLTAWLASSFPKFPSFLVTLAMLSVTAGVAEALQPMQQAIAIRNPGFQHAFGYTSSVLASPPIWYALIVVIGANLILEKSAFGYALHAVGSSSRAARFVGFKVVRTKLCVLTASGFLAAVGGILMAGFVQAGFFAVAKGIEVDAIAAAVIGGTSLFGGRGTVLGTVGGVLILGVLNTGLLIMQAPVNIQLVTKGCVVVLALAVGEYVRLRSARA